ncbi:uncharacterized protein LOC131877512 isoform X2 [Tigriopus californicus]|uniref:uncharacterized protein LOC131877512 isoform X2 n=1 Tax=Tigriopus californicus TaxID=6832 RepID=UPI0027DAA85E|nr:uncharacterized protein LOC131877512 isoform X2 [Tigriopus californicus]
MKFLIIYFLMSPLTLSLQVSNRTLRFRDSKLLPLFKVITFPNDPCGTGGARNGTCYTKEECQAKGGSFSGSCASGFGVCCTFQLKCGGTTSQEFSYLIQSSTSMSPSSGSCTYKICRSSDEICRIRLDFITFSIAGPVAGTTVTKAAGAISTLGGAIGDCTKDSFSVTSPGQSGSPVICGFNSGQHMIVDASDSCNLAAFNIGGMGSTRAWEVKGPSGCLQYFMGKSGVIASYNFPTKSTTVTNTVTHLSNQNYRICIKQEQGMCAICYIPSIVPGTPTEDNQVSFGLSISKPAATAKSSQGTNCQSDYLFIPNVEAAPVNLAIALGAAPGRVCGRIFSTVDDDAATASVCSRIKPFQIVVQTDLDEVTSDVAANADGADTNEMSLGPGGIIGFSLNYQQISC